MRWWGLGEKCTSSNSGRPPGATREDSAGWVLSRVLTSRGKLKIHICVQILLNISSVCSICFVPLQENSTPRCLTKLVAGHSPLPPRLFTTAFRELPPTTFPSSPPRSPSFAMCQSHLGLSASLRCRCHLRAFPPAVPLPGMLFPQIFPGLA